MSLADAQVNVERRVLSQSDLTNYFARFGMLWKRNPALILGAVFVAAFILLAIFGPYNLSLRTD